MQQTTCLPSTIPTPSRQPNRVPEAVRSVSLDPPAVIPNRRHIDKVNVYLVTIAVSDNEVSGRFTVDEPELGLFHYLREASYIIVLKDNVEVVVRPSLFSKQPGDLVPVGTLDVRPLPGTALKHFTARDVVSHWDGVEGHTRVIATTAPLPQAQRGRGAVPAHPRGGIL